MKTCFVGGRGSESTTSSSVGEGHGGRDPPMAGTSGTGGGHQHHTGASSRASARVRKCRRRVHPRNARVGAWRVVHLVEDRQAELQEALVEGDTGRVLVLTTKMTEGAKKLRVISGVRMVS